MGETITVPVALLETFIKDLDEQEKKARTVNKDELATWYHGRASAYRSLLEVWGEN